MYIYSDAWIKKWFWNIKLVSYFEKISRLPPERIKSLKRACIAGFTNENFTMMNREHSVVIIKRGVVIINLRNWTIYRLIFFICYISKIICFISIKICTYHLNLGYIIILPYILYVKLVTIVHFLAFQQR